MGRCIQSRRWCFTINNPSDEDCLAVIKLASGCVYLIAGDEVGASGTPHVQGFCVFNRNVRFSKMTKYLPGAHLEVARGLSSQSSEYCKKDGKFEEYGVCPKDSRLTSSRVVCDWQRYMDLAKADRIDEIPAGMQVRFYRTWFQIRDNNRVSPGCVSELNNFWFVGPSGSGKTRWVYDNFPDAYPKMLNKWWDHYCGQAVVVLNEFGKKYEMLSELLKIWSDHYPFIAEIKGGSLLVRPKVFFITSNYSPEDIWSEPEVLEPVLRRFQVFNFPENAPGQDLVVRLKALV
jgi:hypothetical protein